MPSVHSQYGNLNILATSVTIIVVVTYTLVEIIPDLVRGSIEANLEHESRCENGGNKHRVLLENRVIDRTGQARGHGGGHGEGDCAGVNKRFNDKLDFGAKVTAGDSEFSYCPALNKNHLVSKTQNNSVCGK
ncbi:hypothetical protein EC973_004921 [Apophysomyces ossiformis]|uniref:Uncharacterized protein n=1 Tax=Apophysomyces ossiformis TaxID=679940 RepID=A0A8H7BWT3_9FUNG|nr:hypothetical protein EC973_004921 [Apophysomyces ossiformis]